jgi:hypothetical protein
MHTCHWNKHHERSLEKIKLRTKLGVVPALVLDRLRCHMSPETIDAAHAAKVNLLFMYSGTAMTCSELDAGYFAPTRRMLNRFLDNSAIRDHNSVERCARQALVRTAKNVPAYARFVDRNCGVRKRKGGAKLIKTVVGPNGTFQRPKNQPLLPHHTRQLKTIDEMCAEDAQCKVDMSRELIEPAEGWDDVDIYLDNAAEELANLSTDEELEDGTSGDDDSDARLDSDGELGADSSNADSDDAEPAPLDPSIDALRVATNASACVQ